MSSFNINNHYKLLFDTLKINQIYDETYYKLIDILIREYYLGNNDILLKNDIEKNIRLLSIISNIKNNNLENILYNFDKEHNILINIIQLQMKKLEFLNINPLFKDNIFPPLPSNSVIIQDNKIYNLITYSINDRIIKLCYILFLTIPNILIGGSFRDDLKANLHPEKFKALEKLYPNNYKKLQDEFSSITNLVTKIDKNTGEQTEAYTNGINKWINNAEIYYYFNQSIEFAKFANLINFKIPQFNITIDELLKKKYTGPYDHDPSSTSLYSRIQNIVLSENFRNKMNLFIFLNFHDIKTDLMKLKKINIDITTPTILFNLVYMLLDDKNKIDDPKNQYVLINELSLKIL
jgi:hypothetical protein